LGETLIFEQFYLGCLAHASYLIGSDGIAAVVDPQRDVQIYLDTATTLGLRIAHIVETHLHADFVSGHSELAERTGAAIYLGIGSGATFPHRAVGDGDSIAFGQCRIDFLQTPGHTLESITAVVKDLERGGSPVAVLTGDTLFIGDVGRPDLCDTKTPAELAGLLYDSLHRKVLALPDDVLVYPAHGAGSLCGRNIGADRSSTIGRERRTNYALQPMNREQFVEMMTQRSAGPPRIFPARCRRQPPRRPHARKPAAAGCPVAARSLRNANSRVSPSSIPVRHRHTAAGHVPGSLQIGLGGQFAAWAGTVIGLDQDLILVAEDPNAAGEARLRLARVGIERVRGCWRTVSARWDEADLPLSITPQIAVQDLDARRAEFTVVDVRMQSEWECRPHLGRPDCTRSRTCATVCRPWTERRPSPSTARADTAAPSPAACWNRPASRTFLNVAGGFDAWTTAGLPLIGDYCQMRRILPLLLPKLLSRLSPDWLKTPSY
jgi:hydroxyacylglutathione hydrolase